MNAVIQVGEVNLVDVITSTTQCLQEVERAGLTTATEPWNPSHDAIQKKNLEAIAQGLEDIFTSINVKVCLANSANELTPEEESAYNEFKAIFGRIYTRAKRLLIGIYNFENGRLTVAAAQ
jgi:hypothetical protein